MILYGGARVSVFIVWWRVGKLHASKVFDLFTYNGDPTFVGGVQFEHTTSKHLGAIELLGKGKDGRRFARAWRPIEEHVG